MDEVYIKGTYSRSIYQSNTGYFIGLFKVSEVSDSTLEKYVGRTITFTGYFHDLNDTDHYQFFGKLVHHDKYGEQFQVDHYERIVPEEKDSIVEFLTSGIFKGIGEKKAQAIVDALGEDTLKIILEQPNNLILIPGITEKNISTLHNRLKEYEASYEVILFLTEYGFSNKDSMNIYYHYKDKTKEILGNNPYRLLMDIPEISFKKVDTVALKNGVEKNSIHRIKAAILYIMNEISNTIGHCYYYYDEIAKYMPSVLGIYLEEDEFLSALKELEMDISIIHKEDRYYLRDMYEAETFIVKRIRLLNSNKESIPKNLDSILKELESFYEIKYNEEQLDAIRKSFIKDFLIITGGPGTGKTTIMKGICELYRLMNHLTYEQLNQKIALLAPTGRAAKRISEATLLNASTIHRFLKWSKESNTFQINEYNKSKVEFVIIDEASMIDTYLLSSLLRGLSSNCKIIMIGDDHQLPSVGPGQVLHDLISSNQLEVVFLKHLYRQGLNSKIISLAYDIRNQEIHDDIFNVEDDLTYIKCPDSEVVSNILEIANTYKDYSYKNFQILVPMYKGLNGIDEINNQVQEIFNPKDKLKKELKQGEVVFRETDKVIQLTNMPEDNVYNGDIGLIDRIDNSAKKEIYIDFDNNRVKYTPSNFSNFRLAYAISIHKSQGSEFDVVVLPMVKGYRKMLYQKLVYTAVTRSRKRLFIIGDLDALKIASKNTDSDIRRTTIKDYFINGIV